MGIREMKNTAAAKITPGQVMEVRERYAAGATQGALAREFQMSVGQIGRIVRGESWSRLPQRMATEEELRLSAQRLMELQERVNAGLEGPLETPKPLMPEMPLSEAVKEKLRSFGMERLAGKAADPAPRTIPPDPLSGGEGGEGNSPESALERMERAMQEQSPDKLLEELKGEGK